MACLKHSAIASNKLNKSGGGKLPPELFSRTLMLLSVRKKTEDEFEVYDLDRDNKVVAVFTERWQAIQFMRRKEKINFVRHWA